MVEYKPHGWHEAFPCVCMVLVGWGPGYSTKQQMAAKNWPENCSWTEPTAYGMDYDEDTVPFATDDETREMLEIKEYFDSLVECGRLNDDYTLNEEYEEDKWDDELLCIQLDSTNEIYCGALYYQYKS